VNAPLLSICIPTYNGEKYLSELLLSVETLETVGLDFEVVISDHSSSDLTRAIINCFSQKHARVTVLTTPRYETIGSNWLSAIQQAQGTFLKVVGQDDVLLAKGVLAEIAFLQNNSQCVGVSSRRDLIDERSRRIPLAQRKFREEVESQDHLLKICAQFGTNPLSEPCAVVLRTESLRSVPTLDSSYAIDLHMYWLALQHGSIQTLDSKSACFRISPGSWTAGVRRTTHKEFLSFLREHATEPLPNNRLIELRSWIIGMGRRFVLAGLFLFVNIKKKISRSTNLNFKNSCDVRAQDCNNQT
jgi:hypothetical protein